MNSHLEEFAADGPLVRVGVRLPPVIVARMRAAGRPIPPAVEAVALIDTGADTSILDPAVLAPLVAVGLQMNRMLYVNVPALGPPVPVFEYLVGLELPVGSPTPLRVRSLPVVERSIGALGYQALLGRDVLAGCGFFYDGPGRRFTLTY